MKSWIKSQRFVQVFEFCDVLASILSLNSNANFFLYIFQLTMASLPAPFLDLEIESSDTISSEPFGNFKLARLAGYRSVIARRAITIISATPLTFGTHIICKIFKYCTFINAKSLCFACK